MHEGLSFSDIFDDEISADVKSPEMLKPMEEADWPIQAKNLFKGLWETELLNETHLTDLFHATNTHNLLGMLEDDAVKLTFAGGTESDQSYNKGYSFFLATMRAKYGNYARGREPSKEYIGMYNVVVHLDGDALKTAGFKMFPVNYWGGDSSHSEQEERIVSDKDELKPMANFVKDVHVYIPKDLNHAFVIDDIHKISELAPSRNIKVYFYPPNEKDAFRMQRTERAITDVSQILQPAVFSAGDLEHIQWKSNFEKQYGKSKPNKLEALLRIAKGDYSNIKNYPDKSVLEMLLFHWYDVYPSLMADVHNFRKQHLPIFREVVAAIKKEGVKTFKEFIKKVMDREHDRYDRERGKLEESDTLELNNREYDYENQYALAVFEIYDTFWIYSRTKNKLSKLHSNNKKLQSKLIELDDKGLVNSHTHMWTILDNLKTKNVNIPNINYNKGEKKSKVSGRIWGIQGKIYVTFWESQQNVKIKLRDVEEIIRDMGYVPEKALYVFNGKSDAEVAISYDELKNTVSVSGSEDESESKLKRLIHLNPEIKKAMLNIGPDKLQTYADRLDMPLVKLKQIMGSLDEVQTALSPDKYEIGWSEAFAIFIIYPNNMICVMQETPSKMIYFSNIPEMQSLLNRSVFQKFCSVGDSRHYQLTHYRFNQIVNSCYQKYTKNVYSENLDCRGIVSGRIWRFENEICNVGIWQNVSNLKQNWDLVKWVLDVLNVNPNIAYYTFKDKWKKQFTFDQIMGKKKIDVKNPTIELSKLQHLNPQVKRSILKLPVNKLQSYADRLNIPLIKLKQMLGSMDETID